MADLSTILSNWADTDTVTINSSKTPPKNLLVRFAAGAVTAGMLVGTLGANAIQSGIDFLKQHNPFREEQTINVQQMMENRPIDMQVNYNPFISQSNDLYGIVPTAFRMINDVGIKVIPIINIVSAKRVDGSFMHPYTYDGELGFVKIMLSNKDDIKKPEMHQSVEVDLQGYEKHKKNIGRVNKKEYKEFVVLHEIYHAFDQASQNPFRAAGSHNSISTYNNLVTNLYDSKQDNARSLLKENYADSAALITLLTRHPERAKEIYDGVLNFRSSERGRASELKRFNDHDTTYSLIKTMDLLKENPEIAEKLIKLQHGSDSDKLLAEMMIARLAAGVAVSGFNASMVEQAKHDIQPKNPALAYVSRVGAAELLIQPDPIEMAIDDVERIADKTFEVDSTTGKIQEKVHPKLSVAGALDKIKQDRAKNENDHRTGHKPG